MRIHADQSIELTPGNIASHVYDDGSAYLELGAGAVYHSILIWLGRGDADLAEEARALRKLAEVAAELAAGLESRAGGAGDDAGRAIAADLDERPGNGPLHADTGARSCGAENRKEDRLLFICTAAEGHTGPHMAYDAMISDGGPVPSLCHSWPQESAGDDAGRAVAADLDGQAGAAAPCGWNSGDYVHYAHAGCPGAELDAGRAIAADLDEHDPTGAGDERDYAEEAYNRDFCYACGSSPCTWDGMPDGFHTDDDLTGGES